MAYDNTYEGYLKRTSGTGMQMDEEMFKKEKNKEMQRALEEESAREDRRDRKETANASKTIVQSDTLQQNYPQRQNQAIVSGSINPTLSPQEQLMKQISDAQKNRQIAAIEQAYQKNVGGLQAEKATIDPLFAGQTRQAVTQSAMAKKSFSDFLAEKGLSASGLAGQGEISQNATTQGQLADIEARRGQSLSDIARRTSEVEQARQFGVQGAESDAALTESQSRLNEMLRQQEIAREDAIRREQFSREDARYNQDVARSEAQRQQDIARQDQLRQQSLQREDQLIQQGYTREDAQRQSQLEMQQKDRALQTELDTIGRYSQDYTAEINRRRATPDTADDNLIPYLETAKAQKVQGIEQSKAQQAQAQAEAQQKFAEAQYDRAMEIWKTTGVANDFVSQIIGVAKGTPTNDAQYRNAQLALDKIRASKTPSGTKTDTLTLNQALTQARAILGENATQEEIFALSRQLQGLNVGIPSGNANKPAVTPPKSKNTGSKEVLDWLYKLKQAGDIISIGTFMGDPKNINELKQIISNPTSSDSEIDYAEQILEDYRQYSTGNYITGR